MVLDVLKDKLAPHIERLTLEESVGNIFHGTPNLMHYTAKKDNVDYSLGFRLTQNKDNLLVYSGISQFLPHETSNLRKILEPMHLTSPPGLIFSYLFKSENNLLNADRKGVDVAIARYGFRVKPILVEDLPVVMDEIKTATKILEQPENIKWLQYATHLLTIASEGSRNVEESGKKMVEAGLSRTPIVYAKSKSYELEGEAKGFLDSIKLNDVSTLRKYLL